MTHISICLRLIRSQAGLFAFSLAGLLIANVCGLYAPWAVKQLVDTVLPGKNAYAAIAVLGFLAAAVLVRFIAQFAAEVALVYAGERAAAALRSQLFSAICGQGSGYVRNRGIAAVQARIVQDVESLREGVFGGLVESLYSLLTALCALSLLIVVDPIMTAVLAVYLPICFALYWRYTGALMRMHTERKEAGERLQSVLLDLLRGVRTLSVNAASKKADARFAAVQQNAVRTQMRVHIAGFAMWLGSDLVAGLGTAGLLAVGVHRVIAGALTSGELVAFYSYAGMLFMPVIRLALFGNGVQEARAALTRLADVLSLSAPEKEVLSDVRSMTLRSTSVRYGNVVAVFDFSAELRKGRVYGFVGSSGSGKSSVLSIIAGAEQPSSGTVCVNGMPETGVHGVVSAILHDDRLFEVSVGENIMLGAQEDDREKMQEVAAQAQCGFVSSLPKGFDTVIAPGEGGLSAGEQQRVLLARAWYRGGSVWVLDEATAHLDAETESAVMAALFAKKADRITCIASHRLRWLAEADEIFVMDDGVVAESGTHEELMAKSGLYRTLWNEQMRDEKREVGVAE